jgi:hypothetical protein
MAKTIGPSLSLSAHGSLGKVFTFQTKGKGNAVYFKSKPGQRTPLQLTYNQYQVKVYVSEAVRHWHLLSDSEKELWNDYIK